MKKKITIKVCAHTGIGKSTMAELLTIFLKNNNFDVEHTPMEELDWTTRAGTREQRFEAIRDNREIEVVEVQLARKAHD